MANPVATMTARVQVDKRAVMDDFLKDIKDVQALADGNAIVYKIKADKNSLKDVLKQIHDAKFEIDTDIVIKTRSKDIQAQIDSLFGGSLSLDVDTSAMKELDAQINTVSKDLETAKKKFEQMGKTSSVDAIKKELLATDAELKKLEKSGKYSEKTYNQKAKYILDLVETLKQAGGLLPKGFDKNTLKTYQAYLPKYKPQNLIADPEEIQKQEALVESLTSTLADLTAQKEKMMQAGTTGGTGGVADGIAKEGEKLEKAAEEMSEAADKIDKAEQQIEESATSGSSDKVAESAEETAEAASKEAESFEEAGEAAEKAAEQKEKFANANNEAAQSGEKTEAQTKDNTSSIKEENKALEENIDLIKMLDKLQGIKSKFNLGSEFERAMNAEMDIADFQKIAPSIAAIYNEQNNTSVTVAQVVKAYKAAQKEMQKADMERLQQHLHNMEEQERKDNEVFQEQVNQYKKYIADTEEIRAHNESVRNDNALQDAMNLARIEQEEQRQFLADLNKYEDTLRADIKKYYDDWDAAIKENQKFDAERAKEQAERAKLPIDVQKELTSLDKVIAKYEQYSSVSKEATEAIKKLKDARTNLKVNSDRDTLSNVTNVRTLNSNVLESLITNNDLVKSSAIDTVNRKINELGTSILNDTRLFDKFNAEVVQLESDLKKVGTNAGLDQIKSRVEKLTESIKEESKAIKQADASQEKINKNAESTAIKELDEWNKRATESYNELTSQAEKYYDLLKKEENGTISGTELAYLERLKKEWEDATAVVGKYQTAVGSSGKSESNLVNARAKFNESDVAVALKYAKALGETEQNLRSLAASGKYTSTLNSMLLSVADSIKEINGNPIDLKADGTISQLSGIDKELQEVLDKTKVADFRKAVETSIAKLNLKIEKFMQDNTAMGRKFRKQFEDLKLDWDAEHSYAEVQKISKAFIKLEADVEAAKATGKSFFDTIHERATGLNAQFLARYFSWEDWIRYTRELIQNVVEVDSALTELRKVSDATNERLQQSFEKSAETAQELGSTISDVIGITSDWARLGYNVDEAEELARVTTLFQTVGDNMTAEDTSSYLISTMQGFQLATDQAERIADKYNEVANNFAIDTKGIGEALQRSAASFNAANTDLSEAIALVTATNTVVQDPSSVGTLWKTLSARIRGAKTELEELGEEEDEFTQTTSKLQDLVKGLTGFDILEADQQTFKSIYDIIVGIGKEWQNLSDIEQASLGEALAGKRNANALYAVLNNIETLEKAYQTAEKSAGSAAKEQENYAQSVQYSIDRAKASIEELSYDFLNSQFLKSAIELGNSFIQVLDKIVEHTNALADTFVLLGAYIGIKFRRNIATFASDVTKYLAEIGAKAQLAGMASTEMSASMAGLITLLTKFGPLAAGVALVTTAVVLGAKAWDNYQTSVKEWTDKITETEGRISSLKGEIEQLQSIDYRTQDEQNRLDLLKSELGYQERLLEVEKKRINQQKYGFDTFAEAWDRDNANNVLREDTMKRGQAGLGTVHDASLLPMGYDSAVVLQAALDIEEYNKKLKTLDKDSEEYTKTLEDKEKAELKSSDSLEQLYIDTEDYRQKLKDAEEAQKGFINGSDAWNNAENIKATYSQWIDENERAIKKFEKAIGIFDYSSVIESELSKTKYNGLESRLVDLAKQGKLTKDNLAQYYGKDLVEALAPLEISLDAIYNYIVRISGLVDRKNFVQKVSDSMASIPSGETQLSASSVINGVMRDVGKAAFETWVNNLSEEDAKLLVGIDLELSAYDNWNDVLSKYQEELNKAKGNPLEVGINATITDSVEGISNRLKSQFDELGELYKSIFYGDDNKFSLEKVTNEQLEALRKAFVDAEDERGEKIGVRFAGAKEAVDEFIDTITSAETKSKSLAEQQKITQDAVNKLATKYFYAADGLKELNKDTKDAIEQQLKQLGIANAAEIVDYYTALANGERIATDNSIDLANATADAIAELVTEGKVAPITGQALAMLALQKQLAAGITFGESGNIQQIENLAKAAGAGAIYLEKLARAKQIAAEVDKGNYGRIPELEAITKELETFDFSNSVNVDFSNITNDNKNARSAGKSDADAYVEAYKKEKEKLQSDREAGLIDESTYLDKLKALIDKFFKDRAKYAKNYIDEMKEYLEGMKSLYDSAISGVTTIIQKKIDAANKTKDATVKALNEEKEAAEERYQAEIDAIQAQMDAIDDLIDKKNDEKDAIQDQIDAINEANEARDRSIQLQKAEYDLQRSMNQRTRLVYTGEPGQMVYERDESSVRDARENLQDAQDEIAIAALEKQIKLIEDEIELLEKQKDALSDQQEGIQKMMESSSKYYEKLINEQEKYWDSVVEGLEKQKAKWEELTEIETIANAYSAIEQVFGPLGYKVEDVINGSEAAFEDFKNKYILLLQEMNKGNQPFLDGLDYATNSAKGAFSEISSSAGEIKDALGEVADATAPLADAATNITNMGSAASTASSGMGSLKTATDGIASDVTELNNVKFDGLTKALDDVKKDIEGISNLLVGPTDSIESALTKLNDETVLAQLGEAFDSLSNSIGNVASALGVGGGSNDQDAANTQPTGMDAEATGVAGAGLAKAIEEIKNAATTFIGESVDDEGETAIGRFNLLKSAIETITNDFIGNSEVEGTLLGNINSLLQVTNTALYGGDGAEGAIAAFDAFRESISACCEAASVLLMTIQQMGDLHLPSIEGGTEVSSGEYTGTAKYTGDWSVGKNEKALMGELGPEAVLRDGKYTLVGKNGPEFVNLKKDDIVLNHLQTAAILDKKNQVRTLADGTVLTPIDRKTFSLTNGLPTFSEIRNLVNDQTRAIQESISRITTINNEPKVTINNPSFTVSGVTGEEVMRKIEGSFEGLMLNAYQKAMS